MAITDYAALAGYLLGWGLLWRLPRLPRRAAPTAAGGAVTVVIPARNEEANLPRLLGDLANARPEGARVVVVDDGSEDRTAEVARSFPFVEFVQPPPAEPGWLGKTWACHHGAALAGEGTIVFLDADVRLRGDALARTAALCRDRGGLVTVWPYHEIERPYERLSALPTLITLMTAGAGSLLPPRRPACGFGPVMACSAEDYRRIGGHAAIRGDVVDDFAIAGRFRGAGLPVTNLGGGADVAFRMYPGGFRSLVEGWTKSLARGASGPALGRAACVLLWLTCSLTALGGPHGLFVWTRGAPRAEAFVLYGLFAAQIAVHLRRVGRFGALDALLYPVHVVWTAVLFELSLWSTFVRRRVRWRGRDVPVARSGQDA